MSLSRNRRILVGIAGLVVAGLLPLLPGMNGKLVWGGAAALAVLYAFGILSVVVLTGYVGQVSLCQATFMGISAFTTAAMVNQFSMNYFLAALIGILSAFVLGVLVGIPALRLRGILLAIVTVGVALSFDYYFYQDAAFAWFNGGVGGWRVEGASLFGLQFNAQDFGHLIQVYWLLLVIFAVASVIIVNIHDSGSGRRLRAIRDSEIAAATMGVDLTRYKLLAFGFSAAIAGIGGAFFPLVESSVTNQPFNFFISLQIAAVAVLVGIRFVPAAAIGGVFIVVFPQLLLAAQDFFHVEIKGDWFNVGLGILLVVQVITVPEGVWGQWAHGMERLMTHYEKAPPKAEAPST